MNEFYGWSGLDINNAKCAVVAHDFSTGGDLCTEHVRINGAKLPQYDRHRTYKYLGLQVAVGGSWAREKARVRCDTAACIAALKGSPYNPQQLDQVVRACIVPIFRYGAGLVDWTSRELDGITAMWANARRLAWKLAPGTPHCLHTLHHSDGGGSIPHAKTLWAKEMTNLWSTCRQYDDELRKIALWEWENSVKWIGCRNDNEAASELTKPLQEVQVTDLSNRYRRVCAQLGTKVFWQHPSIVQQETVAGRPSISAVLRQSKVRSNEALLADSVMCDATPIGLRIRRAMKVLNRHQVHGLHDLALPDGGWKAFRDLSIPRHETGWVKADYAALCDALGTAMPQLERARVAAASRGGQQLLHPVNVGPLLKHVRGGGDKLGQARVLSNKHHSIAGVSEPGQ